MLRLPKCLLIAGTTFLPLLSFAHGVTGRDASFLEQSAGLDVAAFMYLGAKHMVTGYDHLLYLLGVIFFLYRLKDVAVFVTLFAVGHSLTLLVGVLGGLQVNPYIVDAIIGLSIVYKAFENVDGFKSCLGRQPNPKAAVFLFGLAHGFGLATKLQGLSLSDDGLVGNMIAFNLGVEIGQLFALIFLLTFIRIWRSSETFNRHSYGFNLFLMFAGFTLFGYQVAGYFYGAQ